MDVVGIFGVVGLIVVVACREWRLPALLAATYLTGAGAGEFLSAVPWALLAGVGIATMLGVVRSELSNASPATARSVLAGIAAVTLFLGLVGSVGSAEDRSS